MFCSLTAGRWSAAARKGCQVLLLDSFGVFGRGGAIRTHDLLNPIQVRYQAALRPDAPSLASLQAHPGPDEARKGRRDITWRRDSSIIRQLGLRIGANTVFPAKRGQSEHLVRGFERESLRGSQDGALPGVRQGRGCDPTRPHPPSRRKQDGRTGEEVSPRLIRAPVTWRESCLYGVPKLRLSSGWTPRLHPTREGPPNAQGWKISKISASAITSTPVSTLRLTDDGCFA